MGVLYGVGLYVLLCVLDLACSIASPYRLRGQWVPPALAGIATLAVWHPLTWRRLKRPQWLPAAVIQT